MGVGNKGVGWESNCVCIIFLEFQSAVCRIGGNSAKCFKLRLKSPIIQRE